MSFDQTSAREIASVIRREASDFRDSQSIVSRIKDNLIDGIKFPSIPGVNTRIDEINHEISGIYEELLNIATLIENAAAAINAQEMAEQRRRQAEEQKRRERQDRERREQEERERKEKEERERREQEEQEERARQSKSKEKTQNSKNSKNKGRTRK